MENLTIKLSIDEIKELIHSNELYIEKLEEKIEIFKNEYDKVERYKSRISKMQSINNKLKTLIEQEEIEQPEPHYKNAPYGSIWDY